MKAVALTRNLIEHCCDGVSGASSVLPLGVARRLLHTHDFLCLLCHLLELSPWSCYGFDSSGRRISFQWHESGCWIADTDEKNWTFVTKTEGQVKFQTYNSVFMILRVY